MIAYGDTIMMFTRAVLTAHRRPPLATMPRQNRYTPARLPMRATLPFAVVLLLLSLSPARAGEADDAFIASLFRVQFDHHLSENLYLDTDPSAELTLDRCVDALSELKPGSVNVFALGHEGWARFPNSLIPPHPALSRDSLAVWRDACDRTRTPFYVYVSTLINYKQNHEHPDSARLFSNGAPADQRIDHNAPFINDRLIPFLREIVLRYRPDGLWLDGDYWSIFPSWNPASRSGFEHWAGVTAPRDFGDPAFARFWEYTLASHAEYLTRVADALRDVKPDCGLVVNAAYTLRQPTPPPDFIARVNLDVPTYYGLEAACLEARYQSSRAGRPFDIVIGSHTEPEGAPYGYPKPPAQLAQEMATILANGGGLSVYVPVSPTGGFDLHDLRDLRRALAEFCLPRRPAFEPTRSAADVAVIHCAAHFAATHTLNELRGAALALLRSNVAFDIVDDATFIARPSRYAAVVLPVDRHVPPALAAALQQFVADGGALVRPSSFASNGAHAENRPDSVEAPSPRDSAAKGSNPPPIDPSPFAMFDRAADPAVRRRIVAELYRVLSARQILRVVAPPWVEVLHRAAEGKQIIHLVNHARGREFRPRMPAVEEVPPVRNVRLMLPLADQPTSVSAVPPDVRVEWKWNSGMVEATLDRLDIHAAIIVETRSRGGSR